MSKYKPEYDELSRKLIESTIKTMNSPVRSKVLIEQSLQEKALIKSFGDYLHENYHVNKLTDNEIQFLYGKFISEAGGPLPAIIKTGGQIVKSVIGGSNVPAKLNPLRSKSGFEGIKSEKPPITASYKDVNPSQQAATPSRTPHAQITPEGNVNIKTSMFGNRYDLKSSPTSSASTASSAAPPKTTGSNVPLREPDNPARLLHGPDGKPLGSGKSVNQPPATTSGGNVPATQGTRQVGPAATPSSAGGGSSSGPKPKSPIDKANATDVKPVEAFSGPKAAPKAPTAPSSGIGSRLATGAAAATVGGAGLVGLAGLNAGQQAPSQQGSGQSTAPKPQGSGQNTTPPQQGSGQSTAPKPQAPPESSRKSTPAYRETSGQGAYDKPGSSGSGWKERAGVGSDRGLGG